HEPPGPHDLSRRHERSRADLGAFLDDGAVQHDGADADAAVVHDGARVDDGAVADRHVVADDARVLGRDVEDRVVLDVRVLSEPHVVVLVSAQHREGPDAGARVDRHVADDGRLGVDVRVGMDARLVSRNLPDHRAPWRKARTSSTTRSGASRIMKWPTPAMRLSVSLEKYSGSRSAQATGRIASASPQSTSVGASTRSVSAGASPWVVRTRSKALWYAKPPRRAPGCEYESTQGASSASVTQAFLPDPWVGKWRRYMRLALRRAPQR